MTKIGCMLKRYPISSPRNREVPPRVTPKGPSPRAMTEGRGIDPTDTGAPPKAQLPEHALSLREGKRVNKGGNTGQKHFSEKTRESPNLSLLDDL